MDLLSRQDSSGRWAGQLYDHKWISTTYTMQLLRRMGLDPEHPQAQDACQQLLDPPAGYGMSPLSSVDHTNSGGAFDDSTVKGFTCQDRLYIRPREFEGLGVDVHNQVQKTISVDIFE